MNILKDGTGLDDIKCEVVETLWTLIKNKQTFVEDLACRVNVLLCFGALCIQ